jgi:tRNA/rRNA methyltransferase
MTGRLIDRVVVVLVRARNPNNIGAVARAMHDFGFQHLRVVNEYAVPFESARSAVDASEVLAGAAAFGSVADAVADCTVVVGTTAVGEGCR